MAPLFTSANSEKRHGRGVLARARSMSNNGITVGNTYAVGGGLLLDSIATAVAAFSIHTRLRTAYTGPLCRIRRASDNQETDIDDSGSGVSANIASWCSGTTGYLVTLYDQSGNGRDWTMATTGNQPLVYSGGTVVGGSGLPAWNNQSTDRLARADAFGLAANGNLTVAWDVDRGTITDNFDWCLGTSAASPLAAGSTTSTGSNLLLSSYAGYQDYSDTASARGYYMMTKTSGSLPSAYLAYKNGSALSVGSNNANNACSINTSGSSIGDHTDGSLIGLGLYGYWIAWDSVLSSGDRSTVDTWASTRYV